MHAPPPATARTTIFVSQSGESGEIVELLKRKLRTKIGSA